MFSFFRRKDQEMPQHIRAVLLFLVEPTWSAQRRDWQEKGCPDSHPFTITDQAFCWLARQPSRFGASGSTVR